AGDTDRIPEMKKVETDIALLPVGGHYTMNADEAIQAAMDFKPALAIPMHYGGAVGTIKDAEKFRNALKGKLDVLIKNRE
ncbi:MBL fold metallo-hydrolase, partial [candidate division FCPU426 bacterium]|nr:MBL fold metallo-hydrolase [candidate division FCPU426 bacterium]